MSGLVGWFSFERNIKEQQSIARSMTNTLSCRGPDDEGLWIDENIFLGHRRLAVVDLEHGHQPMVSDSKGGFPIVLSFVGEIYNFKELREELKDKGHQFTTASDTEVLLHAYLEWGEDLVTYLNGMYAFAIWDSEKETLLLVRDRMGIKPLYYYLLGNDVLFASEPKAILNHPETSAIIDFDGLQELFTIVKTPGHAVFKNMFEVKPGTLLKVNQEGITETVYWQLEARQHTDELDKTIAHVKALLQDIILEQSVADVPVGTLLSGGLDSSAISALVAKAFKEQGKESPLPVFTIDFTGHTENFTPNVQWADPDTPFAIEVAKYINAEHIRVILNHHDIIDNDVRTNTLHAQDLPISTGDMEYSLYLLCRELRKKVTVALSGEGADELFGGYTWFHDPEATQLDSFPWHHMLAKGGGMDALRQCGLWDTLQLENYIQYRYEQAISQSPKLSSESPLEARMRQISFLNLTRWGNFLLDRNDRIGMAVGLEIRIPFLDYRLVDYVFNVPWEMKTFDGREKGLLREAIRSELPDSILERKKSPYPAIQDTKYEEALRARVKATMVPNSPVFKLVPEDKIKELLDVPLGSYSFGGPWSARAVLEKLVEFCQWVEDYNVTVDLSRKD